MHTLMIHDSSHSHEEIIINKDNFPTISMNEGDYIQVYDNENSNLRLTLRIPFLSAQQQQQQQQTNKPTNTSRVDISLLKSVAEVIHLKAFHKVIVEKVNNLNDIAIDNVEMVFRKQFLQRGNLWRYKQEMIGRTVHDGINSSINGIQAQVQELLRNTHHHNNNSNNNNSGSSQQQEEELIGNAASNTNTYTNAKGSNINNSTTVAAAATTTTTKILSGLITSKTHFTFRSRSMRLIWLIQISAEMWEIDQVMMLLSCGMLVIIINHTYIQLYIYMHTFIHK